MLQEATQHYQSDLIYIQRIHYFWKQIYSFLIDKIKKKFIFFDNLSSIKLNNEANKKKSLNIIISKSGNTLETITNVNFLIKRGGVAQLVRAQDS